MSKNSDTDEKESAIQSIYLFSPCLCVPAIHFPSILPLVELEAPLESFWSSCTVFGGYGPSLQALFPILVIDLALLLIRKHLISLADVLKFLNGIRRLILVGVELPVVEIQEMSFLR